MEIIRGKVPCAKKVTCYGPEGIGKSTFASHFPDPVFIDTEGSTKEMDVARFKKPSSWAMLLEQVRYTRDHHDLCKTLVIDTVDWAEQMCIEHVCDKHQKSGLESFGYGSGYVYVREEFGRFLNSLEEVVEQGVNVVLTAHAMLRKFEQPDEMGAYDRWELKLGKKTSSQTSPLVKEWSDALLFANYKTWSVAVDDKGKKRKAQGGKRVMHTQHHPCWDAKNRYGLPEETEFDYGVIRHIIEPGGGTAASSSQGPAMQRAAAPKAEKPAHTQRAGDLVASMPGQPETQDINTGKQIAMDLEEGTGSKPEPGKNTEALAVDPRVPKKLRDLMIANQVDEWNIQNVVEARGYFPGDMEVWEYPEDFVVGCLVAAWDQVYGMIREMKEKDALIFN